MTDNDVLQLREALHEIKVEMTDRLARIETKLEQQQVQVQLLADAKQQPAQGADTGATRALGKVSVGMLELGKLALQIALAVVASVLAVRGGGTP